MPERTVQSSACGCEGEVSANNAVEYRRKVDARESALARAGIPKRYWDIPEDVTHLQAITTNGGLFIHGQVGRGKTHLAVATQKAWMNRHRNSRSVFVDSNSIFSIIRASYDSGESERESIWRFINADLLTYDDLAKGKPGEWSLEKVETIVNERWNSGRPTIFTCQWSGDSLIQRLAEGGSYESAEAIVSRIAGMCKIVRLSGPDRRMVEREA